MMKNLPVKIIGVGEDGAYGGGLGGYGIQGVSQAPIHKEGEGEYKPICELRGCRDYILDIYHVVWWKKGSRFSSWDTDKMRFLFKFDNGLIGNRFWRHFPAMMEDFDKANGYEPFALYPVHGYLESAVILEADARWQATALGVSLVTLAVRFAAAREHWKDNPLFTKGRYGEGPMKEDARYRTNMMPYVYNDFVEMCKKHNIHPTAQPEKLQFGEAHSNMGVFAWTCNEGPGVFKPGVNVSSSWIKSEYFKPFNELFPLCSPRAMPAVRPAGERPVKRQPRGVGRRA